MVTVPEVVPIVQNDMFPVEERDTPLNSDEMLVGTPPMVYPVLLKVTEVAALLLTACILASIRSVITRRAAPLR
jgi:hypothetical protein